MRRIGIMQGARLNSKRVPQKLLEVIGQQRLIDRGLQLLYRVQERTGAVPFLVCCSGDRPLWDAAAALGVEVVEVSDRAIETEDWNEAFAEIPAKIADRFDWIIDANFLCRPFLSVETVVKIVQRSQVAERPFVVTRTHRGLLWDGAGRCILGEGKTANTKTNPLYHDLAHLTYAVPFEMLADEAKVLTLVEPFALDIALVETIDIDTYADLAFARTVANGIPDGNLV